MGLPIWNDPERRNRLWMKQMTVTTFANDNVSSLPPLKAVARPLAGDRSLADNVVQETVLRAFMRINSVQGQTSLPG